MIAPGTLAARSSSGARRARTGRNRRGAIVVMTGILIIAIMIIAAISVDASRIFAAKNELQTASDAAALAAAVQLLGTDSSGAIDTARAYARRNRVENRLIDSVAITYGVWRPATRTFIENGNPVDAVRVTTRHNLPLSLARVFGDSTVSVSSAAVAWTSAPVSESRCATPIALPYGHLLRVLGYAPWTNMDLTDDDIRRLRERAGRDTVFFHYGRRQQGPTDPDIDDDDEYFPVDIDSTWLRDDPATHDRPALSGSDYRSYVNGSRCSRRVMPGDTVRSEPDSKAPSFRDGIGDLCDARGGRLIGARCINSGAAVGIPLKVVFWQGTTPDWRSNSRALLRVRMLGAFVVTRVEDPNLTDPNSRAKLYGYFNVRRDFGPVSAAATPLLRPMLVR